MTEMTESPDVPEPVDGPVDGHVEERVEEAADDAAEPPEAGSDLRTGEPRVDAVLDSLDGLQDQPVEAHVAVFEKAHDELRAALDAPAGDRPPAGPPADAADDPAHD